MIYKFNVRLKPTADRSSVRRLATTLGIDDLDVWRDYYLETAAPLSTSTIDQLKQVLGDRLTETVVVGTPLQKGRMVQVAYKRGIVDNENDSLVALCQLLGIPALAGKVATTYESIHSGLRTAVETHCVNPNIEEVHTVEPSYPTLRPVGHYLPMRTWDLRCSSDAELAWLGTEEGRNLDLAQMKQIREIQIKTGVPHVTDVLLEALDARWSDHCSHTTWRSLGHLLSRLMRASEKTRNRNIVSMFHDNAGVWDFYEGHCLALKAETHNGPSAISAYFGQLTKLGGVLRDILGTGQGADPIGVFEFTATGPVEMPAPQKNRPSPRRIAQETIRAIKEYGNTFGVPMMWSHMTHHPKYRAKPFALGGCIGLIPRGFAKKGQPRSGDHLLVIGGLTGNDGIHGASASSAGSSMDLTTVQIGSPLEQVKFCQALVDLRDAGCIRAVTDVGGAGLNSAVGEMGEACGVWLNTALVPLKTTGLPMWRILLSESQERMVLAVPPERLAEARVLLDRHAVRYTVVGRFTNTGRYCVVYDERLTEEQIVRHDPCTLPPAREVGIDVPYLLLQYEPPLRKVSPPGAQTLQRSRWPTIRPQDLEEVVCRLVRDPELVDQSYAGSQYDSTVQGRTWYGPYYGQHYSVPTSFWAGTPLYGKPYAAVFATAFNPWLFEANPALATRQVFLGLLGALALAGVALEDICLCDNFYTPHKAEGADYWLVRMVEELAESVEFFGTPVISGKDSSAGSADTDEGIISVPAAVFLSALGKVPDVTGLRLNAWQKPGNLLVRIGPDCPSLAGTVASRVFGVFADDVDELARGAYKDYLRALSALPRDLAPSGTPLGPGGVLGQAFLGALGSSLGVDLAEPGGGLHELLFEHRCGALVEVSEQGLAGLSPSLRPTVVGRINDVAGRVTVYGRNILTHEAVEGWRIAYEASLR
ncbi:MAG TPA: AIR synthase-related protein [Gemmataceae bacterium]|nr:AIR synthase-related protein [Gemmataceae bacterium]